MLILEIRLDTVLYDNEIFPILLVSFLPRTIALISIAADRRKFRQWLKVSCSLQSTRKPQTMLVYTSLHLHIYFQMIVFVSPMFAESDEKTPQARCDENHAWCEDVVSTWPA